MASTRLSVPTLVATFFGVVVLMLGLLLPFSFAHPGTIDKSTSHLASADVPDTGSNFRDDCDQMTLDNVTMVASTTCLDDAGNNRTTTLDIDHCIGLGDRGKIVPMKDGNISEEYWCFRCHLLGDGLWCWCKWIRPPEFPKMMNSVLDLDKYIGCKDGHLHCFGYVGLER
ncbi:hypothetical protein MKZ38_001510 [Zalerion maritima]|uniref:Cyanovirin-N domain-containing protein n=1 Tax=Zalerion maritima TaxID=339359 RepID=A0AAD5WRV5_9PEZI|nr:hypothetical protein MKZ38_001510 [Zalerion maritima]